MSHLSPAESLRPQNAAPEPQPLPPRRGQVLDVVERVLLRDGLKPVRIGRLAAEARCSRRTLYKLAATKEELFLVVLDRIMRRIARRGSDAIEQEHDPINQIIAMGTVAAEGIGALTQTFMASVEAYPPAKQLFERHIAAAHATLEALINDAIDQGRYRHIDASTAAEAVLVLVRHFTDAEHAHSTSVSPTDRIAFVFDMFFNDVTTPPIAAPNGPH